MLLWMLLLGCEGGPDTGPIEACVGAEVGALRFRDCAPENLLMISIDTTRRDHLGWFSRGAETPFLDAWLAGAVVLEDHASCSNWTYHALSCVLGGVSAVDQGWVPRGEKEHMAPIPDEQVWLAERLRSEGFDTTLISSNPLFSWSWNTDAGYDISNYLGTVSAEEVITLGLEHLDRVLHGDDRWFLHLHLMDPHTPYAPPAEFLTGLEELDPIGWDLDDEDAYKALSDAWPSLAPEDQALIAAHIDVRYRGAIAYVDHTLSEFWAHEDVQAALDDTLVVLWTDHGEQFYEHGASGHGHQLYQEESSALAAFVARGLDPLRHTGPTSHLDLRPTIVESLGLTPDHDASGDIVGTRDPAEPRFLLAATRQGPVQAVISDGSRLHYEWNGQRSLHDLSTDPTEAVDLYDAEDGTTQALWALLEPEVDRVRSLLPEHEPVEPGP